MCQSGAFDMTDDPQTTHDAEEDTRNRDILIWVNGALVHRDEAKVSVHAPEKNRALGHPYDLNNI